MPFNFQSSPTTGMQYVAPNGIVYIYDSNSSWCVDGRTQTSNPFLNSFKYRTIYTRGYMLGGYKDSSPWTNVNRTQHATDITTNLGDILDRAGGYIDGGWSDYNAYCYNMSNGINAGVTSTWTSSINMQTETGRAHSTSWDITSGRYEVGCIINASLTLAYLSGGGSYVTDKHNYVTDTMYSAGKCPNNPGIGGATMTTTFFGETKGWLIASSAACSITFSTETWVNGGMSTASDGHSKVLGSKHGYGWGHNGGNTATTAITKWNDTTGVSSGVVCYTPNNSGEENFEQGQNWGYCLGHYNGVQNNETYRLNYLTDVVTSLGSDSQPKGHAGASSGANASASSQILGGL
jgi:hypothetical protein